MQIEPTRFQDFGTFLLDIEKMVTMDREELSTLSGSVYHAPSLPKLHTSHVSAGGGPIQTSSIRENRPQPTFWQTVPPKVAPADLSPTSPGGTVQDSRQIRLFKTRFCSYGMECPYMAKGKCLYAHNRDEIRLRPPPPTRLKIALRDDKDEANVAQASVDTSPVGSNESVWSLPDTPGPLMSQSSSRESVDVTEIARSLLENHAQQVAVMGSVKAEIDNRISQRRIALERWFSTEIFGKALESASALEEHMRLVTEKRRVTEELRRKIEIYKRRNTERRETLRQIDRTRMPSRSSIVRNLNFQLESMMTKISKVSIESTARRISLFKQLKTELYPIEFHGKFRSIRGLALPSMPGLKRYESRDAESISTALGYLVHRTELASRILDFPLKLVLVPGGSKSMVKDRFSVPSLQEFPLYMKTNERQKYITALQMLQDTIFHFIKNRVRQVELSADLLDLTESLVDMEVHPNS